MAAISAITSNKFSNGPAQIKIHNTSGFIGKSGMFAFHLPFQHASGFSAWNDDGMFIDSADMSVFFTDDRKFCYSNT